ACGAANFRNSVADIEGAAGDAGQGSEAAQVFGVVWNGGIDSRERTVDEVGPEFFQGHKPIERSNGVCRLFAAIECSRLQDSISLSAGVFIGQDVVVRENADVIACLCFNEATERPRSNSVMSDRDADEERPLRDSIPQNSLDDAPDIPHIRL